MGKQYDTIFSLLIAKDIKFSPSLNLFNNFNKSCALMLDPLILSLL